MCHRLPIRENQPTSLAASLSWLSPRQLVLALVRTHSASYVHSLDHVYGYDGAGTGSQGFFLEASGDCSEAGSLTERA